MAMLESENYYSRKVFRPKFDNYVRYPRLKNHFESANIRPWLSKSLTHKPKAKRRMLRLPDLYEVYVSLPKHIDDPDYDYFLAFRDSCVDKGFPEPTRSIYKYFIDNGNPLDDPLFQKFRDSMVSKDGKTL